MRLYRCSGVYNCALELGNGFYDSALAAGESMEFEIGIVLE